MNFIGRRPNEILSSEDYFWTEWTVAYTQAAKEEGWVLAFVTQDYGRAVKATVAPVGGVLHREACYRVVFGQQPHHVAARKLLKDSPEWPSIVRNALGYRLQHDAPKE